jgi:hypothetical protein
MRNRTILGLAMAVAGLLWSTLALGAADDLINEAIKTALDQARTSIEASPKLEGVKRIGVATLEGEPGVVTDLIKAMLTTTAYDVVLTSDADWGGLLDEFARQVKREDLIIKETAHELRVQGVDAVLYGVVEKAEVAAAEEAGKAGQRATVRLLLNIGSLSKENPGSLLWSEQFTATADDLAEIEVEPETQMVAFMVRWRIPLFALVALLAFFVLWRLYKAGIQPR